MHAQPPKLTARRRIKRFAPLQLGIMIGLFYGVAGLIFVPIILIMSAVVSSLPNQTNRPGIASMSTGVMILFPVIYGVLGFVFGVVGAFIYNSVAKLAGGIEVEVE